MSEGPSVSRAPAVRREESDTSCGVHVQDTPSQSFVDLFESPSQAIRELYSHLNVQSAADDNDIEMPDVQRSPPIVRPGDEQEDLLGLREPTNAAAASNQQLPGPSDPSRLSKGKEAQKQSLHEPSDMPKIKKEDSESVSGFDSVPAYLSFNSKFELDWTGSICEMLSIFEARYGAKVPDNQRSKLLKYRLFIESPEWVKEKFRLLGLLEDHVTWDQCKNLLVSLLDRSHRVRSFATSKPGVEVWANEYLRAVGHGTASTYLKQLLLQVKRLCTYDQDDVNWVVSQMIKGLTSVEKEWLLNEWVLVKRNARNSLYFNRINRYHTEHLFELADRHFIEREEVDRNLDLQASDVRSSYAKRVAAQVKDEMAFLYMDGYVDKLRPKDADEALEQVINEFQTMRIDAGASPESILYSASNTTDPRFTAIRSNWTQWNQFVNCVRNRFDTQGMHQREQKLYQGGFNMGTQQSQQTSYQQSTQSQPRSNLACYICESSEHTSSRCPEGRAIEQSGIAYFDKEEKRWFWGSRENPEINNAGERISTPGYARGKVASGIRQDHQRRLEAGLVRPKQPSQANASQSAPMQATSSGTRMIMAPDIPSVRPLGHPREEELVKESTQLKSILAEMELLNSEYQGMNWKTDVIPQGQPTAEPVTAVVQSDANAARAPDPPRRQQPKRGPTQGAHDKVSKPPQVVRRPLDLERALTRDVVPSVETPDSTGRHESGTDEPRVRLDPMDMEQTPTVQPETQSTSRPEPEVIEIIEIIEPPSQTVRNNQPEAPEMQMIDDIGKTGKLKREKKMYLKDSLRVLYPTDRPLIEHVMNQPVSLPLGMAYRFMPGLADAFDKPIPYTMQRQTREELERQQKEIQELKKASKGARYQVYANEYTEGVKPREVNGHISTGLTRLQGAVDRFVAKGGANSQSKLTDEQSGCRVISLKEGNEGLEGSPGPKQDIRSELKKFGSVGTAMMNGILDLRNISFHSACVADEVPIKEPADLVPRTVNSKEQGRWLIPFREQCPVAPVKIVCDDTQYSVTALIDTGSQVNCIDRRLVEELGLPMYSFPNGHRHYLTVADGSSTEVPGWCTINARIGESSKLFKVHCLVVRQSSFDLLFGEAFNRSARLRIQRNERGACICEATSYDGQEVIRWVAAWPTPSEENVIGVRMIRVSSWDDLTEDEAHETVIMDNGNDEETKSQTNSNSDFETSSVTTSLGIEDDGEDIEDANFNGYRNDHEHQKGFASRIFQMDDGDDDQEIELDKASLNTAEYDAMYEKALWACQQPLPQFNKVQEAGQMNGLTNPKAQMTPYQFASSIFKDGAGGNPRQFPGFQQWVNSLYKRKSEKVRPVDSDEYFGQVPGQAQGWRDEARARQLRERHPDNPNKYDQYYQPRYASFPRGQRLTPERMETFDIGEGLSKEELEALKEMLYRREAALSWSFRECGKLSVDAVGEMEIVTVHHTPWQCKTFPVPKKLEAEVMAMLTDRLEAGRLERSQASYRNPWFLVKKKNGKYRLINNAQHINRVTIRDAGLPPSAGAFSEKFTGSTRQSLLDFDSGYDQVVLAWRSRDITSFHTPLGLLRMTTLPQGGTNSVSQFQRCAEIVLARVVKFAEPYVDDVPVRGAQDDYGGEEVMLGVRRHIMGHLQNLDAVLAEIELAGGTVSGSKLHLVKEGVEILGYWCTKEGRYPTEEKVEKITGWKACYNQKDVRTFLGLCAYYCYWVEYYAIVTQPLTILLKKDESFHWGMEQQQAMDAVKTALSSPPALKIIDYSPNAGEVILGVDASLDGYGGNLNQLSSENPKVRHIVRFVSGVWSTAERNYNAGKLELRALVHCVRRLRLYLYGIRFTVETDAATLVAIVNRVSTDLPGALVQRWLAWLHLFDFDIRHVPGRRNGAADALSRQPEFRDEVPDKPEFDLDDWVDNQLDNIQHHCIGMKQGSHNDLVAPIGHDEQETSVEENLLDENGNALDGIYSDEHHEIARWLVTQRRPPHLTRREFSAMKRKALQFVVQHRTLFRRVRKSTIPLQRVIDDPDERNKVIDALHDELGHKGREQTFWLIFQRYWWPKMYEDVRKRVKCCQLCQLAADGHYQESLRAMPGWPTLFWVIHVDCTGMPESDGKNTLVQARCAMSLWVEARALKGEKSGTVKSSQVAKFLYEDVICNHGVFGCLVTDGGSENQGYVDALMTLYGIRIRTISPLNSRGNGLVEACHKPFAGSLRKVTNGTGRGWPRYLRILILADRCTVKRSTGLTPAYIVQGREYVLPIETDIPTIQNLVYKEGMTTEELLLTRMKQIDLKEQNVEEATARIMRRRLEVKEMWDEQHQRVARPESEQLAVGDLVLVKNVQLDKGFGRKLDFRWLGPYQIIGATPERNYFQLAELDGAPFRKTIHGDRLKKYYQPEESQPTQSTAEEADGDLVAELYEGQEGESEESEVEDEMLSPPPLRRSARVAGREEQGRYWRMVHGVEEEDEGEEEEGEVERAEINSKGQTQSVAVFVRVNPPVSHTDYEGIKVACQNLKPQSLTRWEGRNHILKAESYNQYNDQAKRQSRRCAYKRRKAIRKTKRLEASSEEETKDETYWNFVLTGLRTGERTGKVDDEGREVWRLFD